MNLQVIPSSFPETQLQDLPLWSLVKEHQGQPTALIMVLEER
jgi:hypothetical protein